MSSFTSWKYLYHCTHKHSLLVYYYLLNSFRTWAHSSQWLSVDCNSFDAVSDQLRTSILLHYATAQSLAWHTTCPRLCVHVQTTVEQIVIDKPTGQFQCPLEISTSSVVELTKMLHRGGVNFKKSCPICQSI